METNSADDHHGHYCVGRFGLYMEVIANALTGLMEKRNSIFEPKKICRQSNFFLWSPRMICNVKHAFSKKKKKVCIYSFKD